MSDSSKAIWFGNTADDLRKDKNASTGQLLSLLLAKKKKVGFFCLFFPFNLFLLFCFLKEKYSEDTRKEKEKKTELKMVSSQKFKHGGLLIN